MAKTCYWICVARWALQESGEAKLGKWWNWDKHHLLDLDFFLQKTSDLALLHCYILNKIFSMHGWQPLHLVFSHCNASVIRFHCRTNFDFWHGVHHMFVVKIFTWSFCEGWFMEQQTRPYWFISKHLKKLERFNTRIYRKLPSAT